MTNVEKKNLLKWNTILWPMAMALPACFSIVLASAKFPWPLIFPLLLVGPMLASTEYLVKQSEGEMVTSPMPAT